MSNKKFEIGNVIVLKSGSNRPKTIESIDETNNMVECVWELENGEN